MRITLANSSFTGGGITTYAIELINNLSKHCELSIIIGNDDLCPIVSTDVKVYKYDASLLTNDNLKKLLNLINHEIQPDILICSHAICIPVIAPYLNNSIKVITISHSGKYFSSEYSAFNNEYIDAIIAASSEYNREFLLNKYKIKNEAKIKLIYNSASSLFDYSIFENKTHTDKINIIFVGAALPGKSADLVVQVVKKLIETKLDFTFYWIGNTVVPLAKYIKVIGLHDIKQLIPNDDRIVFTGRIKRREQLLDIVRKSNVFLFPSRVEGCSMALIEALSAGCIPIVADYENSNKEIVNNKGCGFEISHRDVDAYVKRISDIIKQNNKYVDYYDKARQTYEELLSCDKWRNEIINFICSVGNNHKTRKKFSNIGLYFGVIRMKFFNNICQISKTIQCSIPAAYTITKLYVLRKISK